MTTAQFPFIYSSEPRISPTIITVRRGIITEALALLIGPMNVKIQDADPEVLPLVFLALG